MDDHSGSGAHRLGLSPARLLLFSVGYLLSVIVGERAYGSLAVPSPFWFPDSVLLCALLLTPRTGWIALLANAAGVRIIASAVPGTPFWFLLTTVSVDLLKGVVAAWWLQRTLGRTILLNTLHELVVFFGIAAAAVPMLSALLVAPARMALGDRFWPSASGWFMGDAVAQVVVTPALLYWCMGGYKGLRGRVREAVLVMAGLLAIHYLVHDHMITSSPLVLYTPVPFLIWAAVRLHPFGAANMIGLVAAAGMFRAVNAPGGFLTGSPGEVVLSLQLFLLVVAIPVLALAVVTAQRESDWGQLQVLLDAAPVSILMASDGTGRQIIANKAAYALHGVPQGSNLSVDGAPGAAQPFRLTRDGVEIPPNELPLRRSAALGRPVTGDLLTIERADGTRRYLHGNAAPLRDQNGAVRGAVGAFQDITEIRLAEEALRESEARFRLVADNAPVLIWMSAPDGRRVYFNRRWLDFRGRTFEAEAGHGWEDGLHPDDRPKYVDACHRAFAAGSTIDVEYRLLRADGQYRWLMDYGVRRLDAAGGFSGYIGSCVDITERKAADGRLRELSGRLIDAQERARARLARDLHDDLGQRMTLMQLSIARFARSTEGLSLEAHRQLHTILQVVEKITVDIQGLSHSLHPSTLDSLGLVTALRSVCREFGEHSRLNVRFSYQQVPRDVAPETCLSLFRVAQEALTNVVKHSGVGEATLDLSCDSDSLTLVVSDSGVGFDLDRTDQIGAPGLGLSSMRERLFLIGGELHVSSTLGRGTSIRATVRVRPDAKPADPPDVPTEASAR